ncbi:FACT complex subunit [Boothiomyces macroporosus]|uniref:FACT complex subunit POB3 n=1 Tax=Boothiomyces macroporosus TaxID=261099 RepID=A0AAD5UBN4_9FUNG|nr:FACT complex subunit [Boothiomyces macroporosus]
MHWIRVAREYELRIQKKGKIVLKFDGFPKDAFEAIGALVKQFYDVTLEHKEVSTRGYNWGQAEFQDSSLTFTVHNKQAFELPLTEVANTVVSGKSEVSIEFAVPKDVAKRQDALVEVRFYVPGGATEGQVMESGNKRVYRDKDAVDIDDEGDEEGEVSLAAQKAVLDDDGEAVSAATLFCETIKEKSDVGAVTSELICAFADMLCITPRGRFEVDFHAEFFRLRGKTHEYKILYSTITRLLLVPKPDELHYNFVIGLHPPLRQGQTKYPYLVFQFERESEVEMTLNLNEELKEKFSSLQEQYDGPTYQVASDIFSGVVGKKIQTPSPLYKSAQGYSGVKCSLKANEAFLYPLEKSFLSIPKPPIYIPFSEISAVTFSRISSVSTTSTRTFEVKFSLTSGTEYSFSSMAREEHGPLEAFCRNKKISVLNEIGDDGLVVNDDRRKKVDYKDVLDESESEDEDFVAGSDSDVNEEFNEDYSSNSEDGSGSESGSDAGSDDEEKEVKKTIPKKHKKETKDAPKKRQKKEKKEGPKRAMTSFLYFCRDYRGKIKEKNPGMSLGEIGKELGIQWKNVSAEEKQIYEDLANQDKERYQRELKEFKSGGAVKKEKQEEKKAAPKKADVKSEEFVVSDDDDDF